MKVYIVECDEGCDMYGVSRNLIEMGYYVLDGKFGLCDLHEFGISSVSCAVSYMSKWAMSILELYNAGEEVVYDFSSSLRKVIGRNVMQDCLASLFCKIQCEMAEYGIELYEIYLCMNDCFDYVESLSCSNYPWDVIVCGDHETVKDLADEVVRIFDF